MCPVEVWKPSLKTYHGDECRLYSEFCDVIDRLESAIKPFGNQDIISGCRIGFETDFNDIEDFEATINELICINCTEGYMPKNYRILEVYKKSQK